jgi:hypothetical protein
MEQFKDQQNNDHRHTICFDDTTETDGFLAAPYIDPDQNNYLEPWQFAVCPPSAENDKADWRVHGFLADDVFYIVWLDPYHALYCR